MRKLTILLLFLLAGSIQTPAQETPDSSLSQSELGPLRLRLSGSVLWNTDGDDFTFRVCYKDEVDELDLTPLTVVNVVPNLEVRWITPLSVEHISTVLNLKYRRLDFSIYDTTDVVFEWGKSFNAHLNFISVGTEIQLPFFLNPSFGVDVGVCSGSLHTYQNFEGYRLWADGNGSGSFYRVTAGISRSIWRLNVFAEGGILYSSEWEFPPDEYSGDERISFMKDFDRTLGMYGYEISLGVEIGMPIF
jgi:hypothetical protein